MIVRTQIKPSNIPMQSDSSPADVLSLGGRSSAPRSRRRVPLAKRLERDIDRSDSSETETEQDDRAEASSAKSGQNGSYIEGQIERSRAGPGRAKCH